MRGIDLLQRRLLYLRGLGWGKDENNQRKCALTQVYILCSGPLGEWQVFIKSLDDFFLHLADCVCMHDPDRQRVHATALEGHIDVLQNKNNNNNKISKTFHTLQKCDWNVLVVSVIEVSL